MQKAANPCRTAGVEVELLAPPGSSRRTLAEAIAGQIGGRVCPFFHLDSEPSRVRNKPVFYNLTQGFEVRDAQDEPLVRCVDDITLQRDLNRKAPAREGWFRILSDDVRLLRLIRRQTPASATLEDCLWPLGELFGTRPTASEQGIWRLLDEAGSSLALAAPLPGERERACELITMPLPASDRSTLPLLLDCAHELGFELPNEGATHIHFDAQPFCSAPVIADLMLHLHAERTALRKLCNTNPYCRRLGAWPDALLDVVQAADFRQLDWATARQRLQAAKPSKYCDFNIRNLVYEPPGKHTLEIRILPSTLQATEIFAVMDHFQALFAAISN